MKSEKKQRIYKKLKKKKYQPQHCAEVGVYHPATSNIKNYIKNGIRCTLVEPDPKSIALIKELYSDYKNVTLHEVALFDRNGKIELIQRRASTFVKELPDSPSISNDNYKINDKDKFIVECKTFDRIDDGTIDLLSIYIEGSEWFVIKHMVSSPAIISVETHGARYVNPYSNEILKWMEENGYIIWYKTGSDTVFVKQELIPVSSLDKIVLFIKDFRLTLRKKRKDIQKKFVQKK